MTHTQQHQTQSTDGKNYSRSVSTLLTTVITVFLFVLPVIITFSVPKEPGRVEERKRQPAICRKVAELPEIGGTIEVWGDARLVPSCSLMNALKRLDG